eukprot:jgi/Mesen1/7689/ME000405S06979
MFVPTIHQYTVAQAHKRTNVLLAVHAAAPDVVTEAELGEQLAFEHQCISALVSAASPLRTAAPERVQAFQQEHQEKLQQLQQQQLQQQMMQTILGRLESLQAHSCNGLAETLSDPLTPLANAHGLLPGAGLAFPATRAAINSMTDAELTALLDFYGADVGGTVEWKRKRLRPTAAYAGCSLPGWARQKSLIQAAWRGEPGDFLRQTLPSCLPLLLLALLPGAGESGEGQVSLVGRFGGKDGCDAGRSGGEGSEREGWDFVCSGAAAGQGARVVAAAEGGERGRGGALGADTLEGSGDGGGEAGVGIGVRYL